MALDDFPKSTLRVLENHQLDTAQIQALRQCLPMLHRLQQPQPPAAAIHREIKAYWELAVPLRQRLNTHHLLAEHNLALRVAGELIQEGFRREGDGENNSGVANDAIERLALHVDLFCDVLDVAKRLAPDRHSGRPPMWEADWETLRVIHQQLDLGYEEAIRQGRPCEKAEPSVAAGSKFSIAVDACLAAIGVHRNLDEVRSAYASQWREQQRGATGG